MKADDSDTPPKVIRWCIIITAVWLINGASLIYWSYSSLRRPLDLGGTLTEQITATDDQAKQRQFNLLLLRAVDNRIAAVKSLQRRVIFLAGGVIATGAITIWVLLRLQRSLHRYVTYEVRSIADLESE